MPQDESPFMGWLGKEAPGIAPRRGDLSNNPKDAIGRTKAPMHLIPSSALVAESRVYGVGAFKYGPYNWRDSTVAATVYISAIQRHTAAFLDGEDIDPETGQSHMASVRANAGILIDAFATGNVVDDRPKPGVAAAMLRGEQPAAALDRAMTWAQADAKMHRAAQGQPIEGALSPMERELFCMKVKEQNGIPLNPDTTPDPTHDRPFLWYVATPYTAAPSSKEHAYYMAWRVLAELLRRDVRAFCPIAHSHHAGGTLPQDHEFWMAVDRPFMDRCDGLVVMRQPGWKESRGVTEEIQTFSRQGKPVLFFDDPNRNADFVSSVLIGTEWDDLVKALRAVERGEG